MKKERWQIVAFIKSLQASATTEPHTGGVHDHRMLQATRRGKAMKRDLTAISEAAGETLEWKDISSEDEPC